MKQIIETSQSPLENFLGEIVVIYTTRFIYTGKAVAVDDKFIVLDNAKIVYDTGEYSKDRKEWEVAQPTWAKQWTIGVPHIESIGFSPF